MTDGEALLSAVLATRGDDTPRLMYADWLDEFAGDRLGGVARRNVEARAEFIRVQCEIARLPPKPRAAGAKAKLAGLRDRERELFQAVAVMPLFGYFGGHVFADRIDDWQRGFAVRLRVSPVAWTWCGGDLVERQTLETVDLTAEPQWGDAWCSKTFPRIARAGHSADSFACELWPGITFNLPPNAGRWWAGRRPWATR